MKCRTNVHLVPPFSNLKCFWLLMIISIPLFLHKDKTSTRVQSWSVSTFLFLPQQQKWSQLLVLELTLFFVFSQGPCPIQFIFFI